MSISLFSFMMSVLFSTAFILAIHALRNQPFFLKSFGVHTLLIMYCLCLFRMVFVVELPFTIPVELRGSFSHTYARMQRLQVPVGSSSVGITDILIFIWTVVAIALFVRLIWREHISRQQLSLCHNDRSYAAERVLAKVRKKSADRIFVNVCVCPSIDTPIGIGLFQKWIYLPDEEYTQEELYYIMKHEYTHFCNRDGIVKLLTILLCCVFWWNPAVYLLKKDVEQILEIKCDVNATQDFSKTQRLEYLLTIVRTLKGNPKPTDDGSPPLMATGLVSRTEHDDIKERFELITRATKRFGMRYQVAFVGLAVLVTLFSYTFVFQSAFDPPLEDIYTDTSVHNWEPSEVYVMKRKDNSYVLVLGNGEVHPLDEAIAKIYIDNGTYLKEE